MIRGNWEKQHKWRRREQNGGTLSVSYATLGAKRSNDDDDGDDDDDDDDADQNNSPLFKNEQRRDLGHLYYPIYRL